jgi:hypothetical protein
LNSRIFSGFIVATLAGTGEGVGSEFASFGDSSVEPLFELGDGVPSASESLF